MPPPDLDIAPEVAAALAEGRAVVALESTILAHGMPFPLNLETALAIEGDLRAKGVVPATIAVIDGRLRVGLVSADLELLATGRNIAKASRRDLAALVAGRAHGATTVAATMAIAAMAGIAIFATGGIGGVHRGAESTMDVSADLYELARTPVAVVCAGAKSILDIPKTLELLESLGVPVLGYQTDALPAFFCRDSGFAVDARLDSPAAVARVMQAQWGAGLGGGLLVCNPIPEAHALPRALVDAAIADALAECARQGITGKATTPFLLQRVNALTGGQSLAANVQLVLNNARLASAIAVAYAGLALPA